MPFSCQVLPFKKVTDITAALEGDNLPDKVSTPQDTALPVDPSTPVKNILDAKKSLINIQSAKKELFPPDSISSVQTMDEQTNNGAKMDGQPPIYQKKEEELWAKLFA